MNWAAMTNAVLPALKVGDSVYLDKKVAGMPGGLNYFLTFPTRIYTVGRILAGTHCQLIDFMRYGLKTPGGNYIDYFRIPLECLTPLNMAGNPYAPVLAVVPPPQLWPSVPQVGDFVNIVRPSTYKPNPHKDFFINESLLYRVSKVNLINRFCELEDYASHKLQNGLGFHVNTYGYSFDCLRKLTKSTNTTLVAPTGTQKTADPKTEHMYYQPKSEITPQLPGESDKAYMRRILGEY